MKKFILLGITCCLFFAFKNGQEKALPLIKISDNHRYFTTDGKPFFWLGDTGWLLFSKLKREEAIQYLDTRRKQGNRRLLRGDRIENHCDRRRDDHRNRAR